MKIFAIDPLTDARWTDLVATSTHASIFHTPGWLEALRRTYDYTSVVFTDSPPGEPLCNGLLFSRVDSWLTGRRLISVPFSDHCAPLVQTPAMLSGIVEALRASADCERYRYLELRLSRYSILPDGFEKADAFCGHVLHLNRSQDEVFSGFHKSCMQRAIRRAQRENVVCEVGVGGTFLQDFYTLHLLTRRRLGAPVQPFRWFRNLAECVGPQLRIYLARHDQRPVAALLILTHGRRAVYKYGCSDARYKALSATPLLFWKAIQDAHQDGAIEFDLGRSDLDNPGLIAFKDHLGATREDLTYFRHYPRPFPVVHGRWVHAARRAYSVLPHIVREAVGTRLYGHFS